MQFSTSKNISLWMLVAFTCTTALCLTNSAVASEQTMAGAVSEFEAATGMRIWFSFNQPIVTAGTSTKASSSESPEKALLRLKNEFGWEHIVQVESGKDIIVTGGISHSEGYRVTGDGKLPSSSWTHSFVQFPLCRIDDLAKLKQSKVKKYQHQVFTFNDNKDSCSEKCFQAMLDLDRTLILLMDEWRYFVRADSKKSAPENVIELNKNDKPESKSYRQSDFEK